MYGGITQGSIFPRLFTVGHALALAHTPSNQGRIGQMPWTAALLSRSRLLEWAGGPYFGSARGYAPSSTSTIRGIVTACL